MPESADIPGGHVDQLRSELDQHLDARDRAGAVNAALAAVRERRIGVEDLYTQVLSPLLVDTGAAWQSGATRVWEEHFATATVRTIVEGLFPAVVAEAAERQRNGKVALLAEPSGEVHDLGLRMLSDRMLLAGWDVYYIGADTPADEVVAAAKTLNADLVALSVATHYNRVLLRCYLDEIRAALPDVRIGVGGPAFSQDHEWPQHEILTLGDLGLEPPPTSHAPGEPPPSKPEPPTGET